MKIFITDLNQSIKNDFSDIISKLSKQDTERFNRFTNENRRLQFLIGRAMIFRYFGDNFKITLQGKPISKKDGIYLSLAHSHQYVVLAVANQPVGTDIEKISTKRPFKAIAQRLKFENVTNIDDFYRAFTAYEADFKRGMKLSVPYHYFSKENGFMLCVSLSHQEPISIEKVIV